MTHHRVDLLNRVGEDVGFFYVFIAWTANRQVTVKPGRLVSYCCLNLLPSYEETTHIISCCLVLVSQPIYSFPIISLMFSVVSDIAFAVIIRSLKRELCCFLHRETVFSRVVLSREEI